MRENKIFLNYILMGKYDYYVVIYDNKYRYIILLNLVFGGENDFSMMLSIGKVRRVKRYGRYLSMQEYGRKVFIFSVWLCFGKNIDIRYKFYFQRSWSILILRVYFCNFWHLF